jgi:uncharacterized membrane protein YuzA (DUF378 family)
MAELLTALINLLTGAEPTGSETCILDLDTLTQLLIIVGALNWGAIALCPQGNGDLVKIVAQQIGGAQAEQLENIIKGLVGVAGVYQLFNILLPFFPPGTTLYNPCLLIGSA